ncbi:BlaI/MecI/CopY family transcriptional regulator [Singulisphaera rosea]
MPRPVSEILTEREAQLMDVLWRLGDVTAEQVRDALPDEPHDSTVRTLLRSLENKGYVEHDDRGKAYTYRAAISRTKVQRSAVRNVLSRFFGGSAEDLVLRLIEDERITPEQLDEIRQSTQPATDPIDQTPSPSATPDPTSFPARRESRRRGDPS